MTDPHPRPPVDCPVCGLGFAVTRLTCEACGTELTGRFSPCPLCVLGDADLALVQQLVAAAGDLDLASTHTGLDADALRERLRAVADHLGLARPERRRAGTPPGPGSPPEVEDSDFLQRLARGVVEADEALRRLP